MSDDKSHIHLTVMVNDLIIQIDNPIIPIDFVITGVHQTQRRWAH